MPEVVIHDDESFERAQRRFKKRKVSLARPKVRHWGHP